MRNSRNKPNSSKRGQQSKLMHLYAMGQEVQLCGRLDGLNSLSNCFTITGKLPPDSGSLQYRIRKSDERYERVVKQYEIAPLAIKSLAKG